MAPTDWSRLSSKWQLSPEVGAALQDRKPDFIIGVDEVGWGSWAGPLVTCAVLAHVLWSLDGLRDSKKLTLKRKEKMNGLLRQDPSLGFHIFSVDSIMLDKLGPAKAIEFAFQGAIAKALEEAKALSVKTLIITDGDRKIPDVDHVSLIKGDDKVPAIAAASVLAKVYRDQYMTDLGVLYPEYDWGNNKGYDSVAHRAGLTSVGVSTYHRKSYRPIRDLLRGASLSART